MRLLKVWLFAITLIAQSLVPLPFAAETVPGIPAGKPAATIDLATDEGAALVRGQWRYSDTKIVETDFRAPGADQQPTGAPIRTYDYAPYAGGVDFDDSKWEAIPALQLESAAFHRPPVL